MVATLFGLLVSILSWAGTRMFNKLDEMNRNIVTGNQEIHERITELDRRVTVVETKCTLSHGKGGQ